MLHCWIQVSKHYRMLLKVFNNFKVELFVTRAANANTFFTVGDKVTHPHFSHHSEYLKRVPWGCMGGIFTTFVLCM